MLQWNKTVQMHMCMLLERAVATEAKLALVLFEITGKFEQDQSLFGFGGYGSSRHVHYDIHAFTLHVFLCTCSCICIQMQLQVAGACQNEGSKQGYVLCIYRGANLSG